MSAEPTTTGYEKTEGARIPRTRVTPKLSLHSAGMEMIGRGNARGKAQWRTSGHGNSETALRYPKLSKEIWSKQLDNSVIWPTVISLKCMCSTYQLKEGIDT